MMRHFGVLIPATNTTAEIEYTRLLPAEWQAHYARVMTSSQNRTPFSPPKDEDVEYQARLLGAARVEVIFLLQTSASLFADDYDEKVTRLMAGADAPAFTSAMAIGEALRSLGATQVALVSPYSPEVNARASRYYEAKYGLTIAALEGFAASDSYAIGQLGPENAHNAFAKIDRPEIEAFVVLGGNFPTMASLDGWEQEFKKPVITTNQAALWAVRQRLGSSDRFPGLGRLLA
jgi:maleate isomerase